MCAGGGVGLAQGTGAGAASPSGAGAAGTLRTLLTRSVSRDICMGATGVCGGEGAERAAGGGVLDLPSPSDVGPEPLRTEPRRSANFVAAEFRREEGRNMGDSALECKVDQSIVAIQMSKHHLGEY